MDEPKFCIPIPLDRKEIHVINTADLLDANPDLPCLGGRYLQFGGREVFSGLVRTVVCPDDNTMLGRMIEEPGEGRVLVADARGSLRCATIGDRLAEIAQRNGWAGIVVEGAVRDVAALRKLDLGIRALGSTPRRNLKLGGGESDVPVALGGVVISPGDQLWSDEDGIVVAPVGFDVVLPG